MSNSYVESNVKQIKTPPFLEGLMYLKEVSAIQKAFPICNAQQQLCHLVQ